MRIQHNIMAMNANRNLTFNNTQLSKNLEKLSSGYRINRAGDDAAGLAISESMRADISVYKQSINNANDGISMVQTAEGALTEVHDMLNRMETLVSQAANGTYSLEDRTKIQSEITALNDEIKRIQDDTEFNGIKLLDGTLNKDFAVSKNENSKINLKVDKGITTEIKDDVAKIDIKDSTGAKAMKGITHVKTAIKNISTVRSNLGAIQNRLEHTVNNLGVTMENLQNAESTIRDTNIADEMMAYTKNNILIQSAQAMLAQANQVPQGVLQLMQ